MANPKWHEWFNPKGEDISGKTVYDFYDKDHADTVTAIDRKVLKTGKTYSEDCKIPLASGEKLHGILHKFPVFDTDGKIIAIGGIHLDISGKIQAEEALRQSGERLHEAIQSLQQAFAFYDADDRLVAFNDEYARLRPGAREIMKKGGTFEDMIRAHEGSGLGLHLAKSFTEMHGGVLEIESTLGKGTAVILTFPKERTVPIRQKKQP